MNNDLRKKEKNDFKKKIILRKKEKNIFLS